jgi:hypothetical protein
MIISCDLCDGAHELIRCLDIDIVLGARVQNGPLIPEKGQRKRDLCGVIAIKKGHTHAVGLKTRKDEQGAPIEDGDEAEN